MQELLNTVLAACAVPLAGILSAVLWKLYRKIDHEATAQDKANMETEILAATRAGMAMVVKETPHVLQDGLLDPGVRDRVLAGATAYMRQRFPDRTAQIATAAGVGTRATDVNAAVQQTLAARLPNIISTTTSLPGPGQGQGGASIDPATTLAGQAPVAALPP